MLFFLFHIKERVFFLVEQVHFLCIHINLYFLFYNSSFLIATSPGDAQLTKRLFTAVGLCEVPHKAVNMLTIQLI